MSRSSALASKATGYPIAKIAAKLAVGYTLDEIPNDIHRRDHGRLRADPRLLRGQDPALDLREVSRDRRRAHHRHSVRWARPMAIGRTFKEALQKGLRSLEIGRYGLGADGRDGAERGERADTELTLTEIEQKLAVPNSQRIFYLRYALIQGIGIERIYALTGIDPWFLYQIQEIVDGEQRLRDGDPELDRPALWQAKRLGFSDVQIAHLTGTGEDAVAARRRALGIRPVYKLVDTCAAEFRAATPYYYSTYEEENEARVSDRRKVMILGGGPKPASARGSSSTTAACTPPSALREMGIESIMVMSTPTPRRSATDYDTSDKLYFRAR